MLFLNIEEPLDNIDGYGENCDGIVFGANFNQCLKVILKKSLALNLASCLVSCVSIPKLKPVLGTGNKFKQYAFCLLNPLDLNSVVNLPLGTLKNSLA